MSSSKIINNSDEHPSPAPYLPRLRSFEWHDQALTPYALSFLTTRVLETGWTLDFSFLRPVINNVLIPLLAPEKKYRTKNSGPIRFSDGIAELIAECHELIQERKQNATKNTAEEDNNKFFRILDLCSGAGGPSFDAAQKVAEIVSKSNTTVELRISDLIPHPKHWAERRSALTKIRENLQITFQETSVDATNVRPGVARNALWTLHGSFHHFDNDLAARVLKSAVDNDDCDGFLIVELSEHRLLSCLQLIPAAYVLALFSPFFIIQPWSRIPQNLKLYIQCLILLPFFLFTMCWDTVVSCCRTLTTQELLQLAKEKADPEGKMEWHSAVRPLVPGVDFIGSIVYLRGIKKR